MRQRKIKLHNANAFVEAAVSSFTLASMLHEASPSIVWQIGEQKSSTAFSINASMPPSLCMPCLGQAYLDPTQVEKWEQQNRGVFEPWAKMVALNELCFCQVGYLLRTWNRTKKARVRVDACFGCKDHFATLRLCGLLAERMFTCGFAIISFHLVSTIGRYVGIPLCGTHGEGWGT